MKHQPCRRNDGFYSCRVCQWRFVARPSKNNCPGILRIERGNDTYKTLAQWKKKGFAPVTADVIDAVSIVHSTQQYEYYHRDNVRPIRKPPRP
jgi:hypothetical protein